MDLNRRLEVTLGGRGELDLGKLMELAAQVEKNKENLDVSFTEIIREKIGLIKGYNEKFMGILGKGRLELADFYAVGELVEKSVKDGVRVNNFDQLNFLKKSFLWTLDFKTFFDDYGENLGRENFMKIVETNQSRPTVPQTFDYEQLLEKINSFGEQLFTEKKIEFLKELLKPVYCVTITDARIKFLINNFKIFIWRFDVEKKLSESEIS